MHVQLKRWLVFLQSEVQEHISILSNKQVFDFYLNTKKLQLRGMLTLSTVAGMWEQAEMKNITVLGLRAASGLSYCTLLLTLASLQAAVVTSSCSIPWGRD